MDQQLKKGIKIVGIACASFDRIKDKEVLVYGVVYRGAELVEGFMKCKVIVDGNDATEKIAEMIINSSHKEQLKIIITRGITIAGFNYIDLEKLYNLISLPVISVVDRIPDLVSIEEALTNLPDGFIRLGILKKYLPLKECHTSKGEDPVYVQFAGIEPEKVIKLLQEITIVGRIPEPIRVARLIATSL
ncbi:MAG: DUF99 family protein [Asgard group archaeon]|nr:DUF99 family protein [Asgard group archaeon]